MRRSRIGALLFVLAAAAQAVAAEAVPATGASATMPFPDNAELRKRYFTELITAPRDAVISFGEKSHDSASGPVRVSVLQRADDFIVSFLNAPPGGGSGAGRGSYIIQRNNSKGYLLQAKILLLDDPSCYARLYPQAESTRMDIVMYGAVVKKGLYAGGLFYYVLSAPFSEIVERTRAAFDWGSVLRPTVKAGAGGLTAGGLAALAFRPAAAGVDSLLAELAARGYPAVELSGSFPALGLSDDRDPWSPRLPAGDFPRYEAGRGLAAPALRAALYLDSLGHPDSAWILVGERLRVLALSGSGSVASSLSFHAEGGELAWPGLAAAMAAEPGARLRVIRVSLPKASP